jgi:hypothetical protein
MIIEKFISINDVMLLDLVIKEKEKIILAHFDA